MNNNKLANRIRTSLSLSLLPVLLTLLVGCSSGGDSASPAPTINIANTSVMEGNGVTSSLVFTLTASATVGSGATVQYATSNGSATAGVDYTASSGTFTFPQGQSTATITILVNGDTLLEADETLTLTLSNPVNLTLGATSVATGTITNDDATTFNGYFSGSATVNSIAISDLIGLAYDDVDVTGKRLMLFSRSGEQNVLYDITGITLDSGNDYSGVARVYINGSSAQSGVAVTATIDGAQITGTLGGTGLGMGTFTITFNPANNVGATLARIEGYGLTLWQGNVFGYDVDGVGFSFRESTGMYAGADNTSQYCLYTAALVIPASQFNIYQFAHSIVDQTTNTCLAPYASANHTGFAAVTTTTTTDDTLVYAFSNGNIALFAVLNH